MQKAKKQVKRKGAKRSFTIEIDKDRSVILQAMFSAVDLVPELEEKLMELIAEKGVSKKTYTAFYQEWWERMHPYGFCATPDECEWVDDNKTKK